MGVRSKALTDLSPLSRSGHQESEAAAPRSECHPLSSRREAQAGPAKSLHLQSDMRASSHHSRSVQGDRWSSSGGPWHRIAPSLTEPGYPPNPTGTTAKEAGNRPPREPISRPRNDRRICHSRAPRWRARGRLITIGIRRRTALWPASSRSTNI